MDASATINACWVRLGVTPEELRLDTTLRCGQSFRWKPTGDNEWTSTLGAKLVSLRQTPTDVFYCDRIPASADEKTNDELHELLHDYFHLNTSLSKLYGLWSSQDPHFAKLTSNNPGMKGVRVLRQDPSETLFSFICSSNNHIGRIEKMVTALCTRYGAYIGTHDSIPYYSFPCISKLVNCGNLEEQLREAGFGYRAKYISKTAQKLWERHGSGIGGPERWLRSLREKGYEECKREMMEMDGVGPKVADCVCLMALDKAEVVPVDTHVWQIACRDYGFKSHTQTGQKTTMTPKLYTAVQSLFSKVWGDHSGWAHSVLFTADLKSFEHHRTSIEIKTEVTEIGHKRHNSSQDTKKISEPTATSTIRKIEESVEGESSFVRRSQRYTKMVRYTK